VADNKRLIGVKIRNREPDFCIRDTCEAIDKQDLSRFVRESFGFSYQSDDAKRNMKKS